MMKNKFLPIIFISVAAVTISGCQSSFSNIFQFGTSPISVVEKYLKAYRDMDTEAAYALLSDSRKSKIHGKSGLQMAMGMVHGFSMFGGSGPDTLKVLEVKQEKIEGNTAIITALIGEKKPQEAQFRLIIEEGKWKIDDTGSSQDPFLESFNSQTPTKAIYSQKQKSFNIFSFISNIFPASKEKPQPLFPIIENKRQGYIDRQGKVIIQPQFDSGAWLDESLDSPDGLLTVRIGEKSGYADRKGTIVIQPQFDTAFEFSEGLGRISVDNKYGFVDTEGNLVIEPQFDSAEDFSNGRAAVQLKVGSSTTRSGYIDSTGKIVINTVFDSARPFSDGIANVQLNGKWGLIDTHGNTIVKPQYDSIESKSKTLFSEGLTQFYVKGKSGYLNKAGAVVIQHQFDMANDFSEGLASFRIGKGLWKEGYINTAGKVVIRPQFESARQFSEGLAAVEVNNKVGYIDKTGTFVISPKFDSGYEFKKGLAVVSINGMSGTINTAGTMVIPAKFPYIDSLTHERELLRVQIDGKKWGYIDHKGNMVWSGEGMLLD